MLRRILLTALATAGVITGASPAAADPEAPPPPIPDVFAYMPVNPSDYTVNSGKWFAFAGPAGVVCILDSMKGDYGCSGPIPGAPGGASRAPSTVLLHVDHASLSYRFAELRLDMHVRERD